jgi:Kelch motif protein
LASAEIYDPAERTWTATGSLTDARDVGPVMAPLGDGRVLIAGGGATPESPPDASTELFDPSAGTWSAGGKLITGRMAMNFTSLADGRVFIVGGYDLNGTLASAELFDPTTETWTSAGSMATDRFGHAVATLADGRVLVVGGRVAGDALTSSAEVYSEGSVN